MSRFDYANLKREVYQLKNELEEYQAMLVVAEEHICGGAMYEYKKAKKAAYMKLRNARREKANAERVPR